MCNQDIRLNCQSPEEAMTSLSTIFQAPVDALNEFFNSLKGPGDEQVTTVIDRFWETFTTNSQLSNVIFFHGTRAFTTNAGEARRSFEENGLQALTNTSEELWGKLYSVLTQDNLTKELWDEFKNAFQAGELHDLYSGAGRSNGEQGPFGFLIQEQMTATNCHRNYAERGSEFIDDVCSKFDDYFEWATNSYHRYIQNTLGVIVAFSTNNFNEAQVRSYISSCVEYIWRCQHNEGGEIWAASYDGRGKSIPPENIKRVSIINAD